MRSASGAEPGPTWHDCAREERARSTSVSLVLDAGALIAIERAVPFVIALVEKERSARMRPVTHGGVVGQVWRTGSGRQARLAWFLRGLDVRPIDGELGRRAGALLAKAGTRDVIDAAIVLLAHDGDTIVTSDQNDLAVLAAASDLHVEIIPV